MPIQSYLELVKWEFSPPRPVLERQVRPRLTDFIAPTEAWSYTTSWSHEDFLKFSNCKQRALTYIQAVQDVNPSSRTSLHQYVMATGMAERYQLDAAQGLFERFERHVPFLLRSNESHTIDFIRAIQLADHFSAHQFSATVQDIWLNKLSQGKFPINPAIITADDYELQPLMAGAMYQKLKRSGNRAKNWDKPPGPNSDPQITEANRKRMHSGYTYLARHSEKLFNPKEPLPITKAEECECHSECVKTWSSAWRAAMKKRKQDVDKRPADLKSNLTSLKRVLESDRNLRDRERICKGCRWSGLKIIDQKIEQLPKLLPHIFDL